MNKNHQELVVQLDLEHDPEKAIKTIQEIGRDRQHPVILDMWAYFIACEWLDEIVTLVQNEQHLVRFKDGNIHNRTPIRENELNRCVRIFMGAKRKFAELLLGRRHLVYHVFYHTPERLDMSQSCFEQRYCKMLNRVANLFLENEDKRCLICLNKRAGFIEDCLWIDECWEEGSMELPQKIWRRFRLLLEIHDRVEYPMSCFSEAAAFYVVDEWGKLLSTEEDFVTCSQLPSNYLRANYRDYVYQLHAKLMWKIIKDQDFPRFVADYWFSGNVKRRLSGMLVHIDEETVEQILNTAIAVRG